MSHSKRNTSLAFFTSYERSLLKSSWGSQSTRLSRDSFLPFSACRLCLLPARQPVACASKGHFFCRECAMSNMLAQHKEIKRLEKEERKRRAERRDEDAREEQEAAARAVEEFEKVQMGLNAKLGGVGKTRKVVGRQGGKIVVEETLDEEPGERDHNRDGALTTTTTTTTRGTKRKFELDEDELLRIANEERSRAKRAIAQEKAEASKTQLPSFWISSLTPDTASRKASSKLGDMLAKGAMKSICPASSKDATHAFALKDLVPVNFTEEKDERSGDAVRVCPSCKKGLGGGMKVMLTKPCGHVICKACVQQFMMPAENTDPDARLQCYVCDTDLGAPSQSQSAPGGGFKHSKPRGSKSLQDGTVVGQNEDEAGSENKGAKEKEGRRRGHEQERGMVEIDAQASGTGFAGAGKNVVAKEGVAFQC